MIVEFRAARTAVGDRITLAWARSWRRLWGHQVMESMLAEAPPLDFLIGSIHTLSEKIGPGPVFPFPRMNRKARDCLADYRGPGAEAHGWGRLGTGSSDAALRYLNENRGCLASFDGFKRGDRGDLPPHHPQGHRDRAQHQPGQHPLPGRKVAADVPLLGGEIVTLGTDAHTPGVVGCAIREGQACCGSGFRRFATFRKWETGVA